MVREGKAVKVKDTLTAEALALKVPYRLAGNALEGLRLTELLQLLLLT